MMRNKVFINHLTLICIYLRVCLSIKFLIIYKISQKDTNSMFYKFCDI